MLDPRRFSFLPPPPLPKPPEPTVRSVRPRPYSLASINFPRSSARGTLDVTAPEETTVALHRLAHNLHVVSAPAAKQVAAVDGRRGDVAHAARSSGRAVRRVGVAKVRRRFVEDEVARTRLPGTFIFHAQNSRALLRLHHFDCVAVFEKQAFADEVEFLRVLHPAGLEIARSTYAVALAFLQSLFPQHLW